MSNSNLAGLLSTTQKEIADRQVIKLISSTERLEKCASCHHLKCYHSAEGNMKCKYEVCFKRCKGFVQKTKVAREKEK